MLRTVKAKAQNARPSLPTICSRCRRSGAPWKRIGINLAPPSRYQDINILQGNGNAMDCFSDQRFDTVLCNARIIGAGRKA